MGAFFSSTKRERGFTDTSGVATKTARRPNAKANTEANNASGSNANKRPTNGGKARSSGVATGLANGQRGVASGGLGYAGNQLGGSMRMSANDANRAANAREQAVRQNEVRRAVKQDPRLLTQLEAKYAQDPEFQRWTNGQGTLNEAAAIKMALRHLSN